MTRHPPWLTYLAVNVAVLAAYFALTGAGAPDGIPAVLYLGVSAAAVVAVVVGTRRHRPGGRTGWLLLAAGQFLFTAAEVCAYGLEYLADGFTEPSIADVLYVAAYPLLAAGMLVFVRRRTPGWDAASMVDAAIVAISAGLLCWLFVVEPLTRDPELTTAAKVVQGAYPVMDLVILVLAVRMILGIGVRTASLALLVTAVLLLLAADTGYAVLNLLGADSFVSPLDALWLLSYACLGAAALHPSMRRIDERSAVATPDAGAARLSLLTVAVLIAPVLQVFQYLRGDDLHVLLINGACVAMVGLVIVRMSGLVAAQRNAAITDGLTGLKSRRYLEQALATEVQRSGRSGQSVGLLIVDVDHFKSVNDTYGHPGGDRVLIEVARRLSADSRAGTVIARYGGEEFALLLPHTGAEGIAAAAENIRRSIANTPFPVRAGTLIGVTVSVGAACLPDHAETAEALVLNADNALYAAKAAGRDRSVVCAPPAGPARERAYSATG